MALIIVFTAAFNASFASVRGKSEVGYLWVREFSKKVKRTTEKARRIPVSYTHLDVYKRQVFDYI